MDIDKTIKEKKLEKLELEIQNLQKISKNPGVWNSLEVVKLLLSALFPIILLIITLQASHRLKTLERNDLAITKQNEISIENNKRIYQLRFQVYQQVATRLNEIYCFYYYVGNWKEISPERILENKRFCDQAMFSYQSLFSPTFFNSYKNFMEESFDTYSGTGQDAKLLTDLNSHKNFYKGAENWTAQWDALFYAGQDRDFLEVRRKTHENYNQLLTLLSTELKIEEVQINTEFRDFKPQ